MRSFAASSSCSHSTENTKICAKKKKSVSDDNESRLDVIRSTYLYVCQLDLRLFTDSGLV